MTFLCTDCGNHLSTKEYQDLGLCVECLDKPDASTLYYIPSTYGSAVERFDNVLTGDYYDN